MVQKMFLQVNANSLEQAGLAASALYPLYPLMNSYCYCNTMYTIDPASKVMTVRAQHAIPAGTEITTRYVVPLLEQPARALHIQRAWGFSCSCPRCMSPSELGSCYSAILCTECRYRGKVTRNI